MNNGVGLWFPQAIYYADDVMSEEANKKVLKACDEVYNNVDSFNNCTYTSYKNSNFVGMEEFDELHFTVINHLNGFLEYMKCKEELVLKESWMSRSGPGDYMNEHPHGRCVFSAVYYPAAPEGSAPLVLHNPFRDHMTLNCDAEIGMDTCSYEAKERRLLIFRSYMPHSVPKGTNVDPRTSVAMNFYYA